MALPHRTRLLVFLLVAPWCAATLGAQAPGETPPFAETIEVREVEVRFDLSSLPPFESLGKKGREDFKVFEDGVERPLTQFAPGEPGDWTYLLYFDAQLAGPETRAAAASALADQAARLTAGGRAEILVADPLPRTRLVTGLPEVLSTALNDLASEARRSPALKAKPPAQVVSARLEQLDRLTVELASRGGGGARALLVACDSWPLDADAADRLARNRRRENGEAPALSSLDEATRALAGYGWVVYPLTIGPRPEAPGPKDRGVQVSVGGGGDQRVSAPILNLPGGTPSSPTEERQMDAHLDIGLTPLARLARATSGSLIADPTRLGPELAQLGGRQRLAFRSPEPRPGTLLPLEVRWTGGDGRALQLPPWVRASTPPEVAAARLRGLLRGDPAPPGGGFELSATPGTNGAVWRLVACIPADGADRPVRASFARAEREQTTVRVGESQLLTPSERGLCTQLELAAGPPGSRLAVVVEDLSNETWTGWVSPTG